jgi:hypothetical protein
MNRQRPPRLVVTPPAVPGTEYPVAHPPVWHYGPDVPIVGSSGRGILGFCIALFMLLPGYVLAMLLFVGLGALQSASPSDGSSFTTSSLLLCMLGTAVLIGAMFAWMASAPHVQAFTFDEHQQRLTLIVTRRGRRPTEVRVPFSDIIYVCPYVLARFDRDGHFRVVCQGPKDKVFEYQLGEGISLDEMAFHAEWLRGMIGERMHELLNLDK